MDRGYVDFDRLYRFVLAGAFFVTRAKAGLRSHRLESRPVDGSTGVRNDQIVWLTLRRSRERCPDRFRRVSYRDPETKKGLVFLTNNFDLPPLVIAHLYIRAAGAWNCFSSGSSRTCGSNTFSARPTTPLRPKSGSPSALICWWAILRKELGLDLSLSQILQVLSVTCGSSLFSVESELREAELITKTTSQNQMPNSPNQLIFKIF
jgi:hypothetical protein